MPKSRSMFTPSSASGFPQEIYIAPALLPHMIPAGSHLIGDYWPLGEDRVDLTRKCSEHIPIPQIMPKLTGLSVPNRHLSYQSP